MIGGLISLQYCVGFFHPSTRISHKYTHVSSLLNFPSMSHPVPPLQVITELWLEFPESFIKFPLAIYFPSFGPGLYGKGYLHRRKHGWEKHSDHFLCLPHLPGGETNPAPKSWEPGHEALTTGLLLSFCCVCLFVFIDPRNAFLF